MGLHEGVKYQRGFVRTSENKENNNKSKQCKGEFQGCDRKHISLDYWVQAFNRISIE